MRDFYFSPVSETFVKSRDYRRLVSVCHLKHVEKYILLLLDDALHDPHLYSNVIGHIYLSRF